MVPRVFHQTPYPVPRTPYPGTPYPVPRPRVFHLAKKNTSSIPPTSYGGGDGGCPWSVNAHGKRAEFLACYAYVWYRHYSSGWKGPTNCFASIISFATWSYFFSLPGKKASLNRQNESKKQGSKEWHDVGLVPVTWFLRSKRPSFMCRPSRL